MFILTNNNFACASRYFVHFFAVVAPLRHETSYPNFSGPLYGAGEHNTKIAAFFFFKLDNERHGPKENSAKVCQIKWNWRRLVKFETVRIDF